MELLSIQVGKLVRFAELTLFKETSTMSNLSRHFNELPFCHMFEHLDGKTTGPSTSKGPIDGKLLCCQELSVVNFQKKYCQIAEIDRNVKISNIYFIFQRQ
jgi:hypothetical protein